MGRARGVASLAAVVGLLIVPAGAGAAVTSCPSPPTAYTGSDAVVGQLVAMQTDEAQTCNAITDRLDALGGKLDTLDGDLTAGTAQAHTDAGTIAGKVDGVSTIVGGWTADHPLHVDLPSGGSGQAVQVTNWPNDQTVALDSASQAQADGIGQSTHGDLWVLIGVIVGVFALDVFLRKVWP